MDALFREMTQALHGIRDAVRQELATLSEGRAIDREPLVRLREVVAEAGDQADSLFQMVYHGGADQDLLDDVENLCDFFRDTEEQIAVILGAGQG